MSTTQNPRVVAGGSRGEQRTDDPDELDHGLDLWVGRDLLVPRQLDGPVNVSLDGGAEATGSSPMSASAAAPPSAADLDAGKILAGPSDPVDWPSWRRHLADFSRQVFERIPVGAVSGPKPQAWAAQCRTVFLAWLWDDRLYDFDRDEFTPDRLIAEMDHQFGGIDGIVLWHAYPVIGVDDRNQFDFYDVPGLSDLVAWFHAHHIRVFLNYNPWDTATARRSGTDAVELRHTLDALDADGLFLDTLREGSVDLITTVGTDRVLESESRLSVAAMRTHQLSWAQWFADSPVPGVLRAHWLDRQHMQHHTRRWNRDHSEELQSAHLNGCGVLLWDNVFGAWVGWSERDLATHRRMRAIHTSFGDLLADGDWIPLIDLGPQAFAAGVFGACFADTSRELYLLVNRSAKATTVQVRLDAVRLDAREPGTPESAGDRVYTDLFGGSDGRMTVGCAIVVTLPGRGVGAVLIAPERGPLLPGGISTDVSFPARPLVHRPSPWLPRELPVTGQGIPVPTGSHRTEMRFRRRENGMLTGAWWVDAWKPLAPDLHAEMTQDCTTLVPDGVRVRVESVTKGEFATFLRESGYRPRISHRFLADWPASAAQTGMGLCAARLDEPVTFVDIAEAQAYAAWVGGRLPSQAEWHLAAARSVGLPLIWQWTSDHYQEGPSRFDLLVGGTAQERAGSGWYFDSGPQPAGWVAKLLEPGRGLSRSATVGFGIAWGPESVTNFQSQRLVAPGPPIDY